MIKTSLSRKKNQTRRNQPAATTKLLQITLPSTTKIISINLNNKKFRSKLTSLRQGKNSKQRYKKQNKYASQLKERKKLKIKHPHYHKLKRKLFLVKGLFKKMTLKKSLIG
jgi:hypothetical protein